MLVVFAAATVAVGVKTPAIDPALWPAPAAGAPVSVDAWAAISQSFDIVLPSTVGSETVLGAAAARYKSRIAALVATESGASADSTVSALVVKVDDAASLTPFTFPTVESYNLTLGASGELVLAAQTQWGALRGFETVLQLCEGSLIGGGVAAVPTPLAIQDSPRFAWRGVMMDLARHFYSVKFIMKTMDVMEANKMSILHLHITDDQSFPIESDAVPELAAMGAFHPSQKYSEEDVAQLVAYGVSRGIHVVPEFDMPAHTAGEVVGDPVT